MDFVSADHHFGHANVVKWRDAYDDLEKMNLDLIRRWNNTVSPKDTVFYLGDIVMGNRLENLEYVRQLNGKIFLIPGNHDHVHRMHNRSAEWGKKWIDAYSDVGLICCSESLTGTLNGISYEMHHFPYEGDHTEEERYTEWRPERSPDIDVLLHGHIHKLWKQNGNQINVGVDVWDFAPVELSVALSQISEIKENM